VIVTYWRSPRHFKSCIDRYFSFEEFRHGTTGFSGFDRGIELLLGCTGNLSRQVEMAFRDLEMLADLFESNGRGCFQFLGFQAFLSLAGRKPPSQSIPRVQQPNSSLVSYRLRFQIAC